MNLVHTVLRLTGVCFLVFSLPPVVLAAQSAASPPPVSIPSPPLGGLLQILLGLAIVLAAVWATAWLLRRFAPGQGSAGGALKVVGGLMIGPKERVVVVEAGESWLLLGVAQGQVNLLHTMPKPEGVATPGPDELHGKNFAVWLKQALQGRRSA